MGMGFRSRGGRGVSQSARGFRGNIARPQAAVPQTQGPSQRTQPKAGFAGKFRSAAADQMLEGQA
jgi:hypothetical protein